MTPYQRRRNPYVNRMIQDMQIRNFAASTIDAYTWHVDKFCQHFGKTPEELGLEEIRQYQIYLVNEKKASWSSFNGGLRPTLSVRSDPRQAVGRPAHPLRQTT